MAEPYAKAEGERERKILNFREWKGMDIRSPRQSIADDEFYWLENINPIGPGNAVVIPGHTKLALTGSGVTAGHMSSQPYVAETINIAGVDYCIVICQDGSAYQILLTAPYTSTTIATAGKFNNGSTASASAAITQWNNLGVLIADPTTTSPSHTGGYYDWNVTAGNTLTSIGAEPGNGIATYAGRVWIAGGRSVTYSDVGSYNSFAGAGGSFTISDSTLHNVITQLYSANNFLYIFGDDSVDVLGDVRVVSGVTQFTRTNITASTGTKYAQSIFPYYRGLAFAASNGFYLLSGATPQKVSNALDLLYSQIVLTSPISGAQVTINNILTAAFLFSFNDIFVKNTTRSVLALYAENKWYLASQSSTLQILVTSPNAQSQTLYGFDSSGYMYSLFSSASSVDTPLLMTKLWSGSSPILEKQTIRVGIGAVFPTAATSGTTKITVDNEKSAGQTITLSGTNQMIFVGTGNIQFTGSGGANIYWSATGYTFQQAFSPTRGGNYMGLSVYPSVPGQIIDLLSLEYREGARWN